MRCVFIAILLRVYHVRLLKYAWRMSLVQFNSFWFIFILKIMA